jgi:hypothetical protein
MDGVEVKIVSPGDAQDLSEDPRHSEERIANS